LAILDIRMPDLNELQLYYRLKAINRKIKILFVSALDAVPELVSILPDVKITNDIIKKPVALNDFIMTDCKNCPCSIIDIHCLTKLRLVVIVICL